MDNERLLRGALYGYQQEMLAEEAKLDELQRFADSAHLQVTAELTRLKKRFSEVRQGMMMACALGGLTPTLIGLPSVAPSFQREVDPQTPPPGQSLAPRPGPPIRWLPKKRPAGERIGVRIERLLDSHPARLWSVSEVRDELGEATAGSISGALKRLAKNGTIACTDSGAGVYCKLGKEERARQREVMKGKDLSQRL